MGCHSLKILHFPQAMEVTTSLLGSPLYVPISRAGPQGQWYRATMRAGSHAARFLAFTEHPGGVSPSPFSVSLQSIPT